jgi:hypothetical protein
MLPQNLTWEKEHILKAREAVMTLIAHVNNN